MIEAQFNVSVALLIRTTMQLDLITEIMGINASMVFQGNRMPSTVAETESSDVWVYHMRFKDPNEVDDCVKEFFKTIPRIAEKISVVSRCGTIALRISLVSEYAQIGFSLSPEITQLLSNMGIPLEVTLFSYGMCIDE